MQWSKAANAGFSDRASDPGSPKAGAPQPNPDYDTNNFVAKGSGNTLRKLFQRLAGLRLREETLMNGDFEIVKLSGE